MIKSFFQSIPGFGAPPAVPCASPALTFDRDGVMRVRVGSHPDTPAGWASAGMRCRIVASDRCATYFDSDSSPDFHFHIEAGQVVHYLALRRADAPAVPLGWSNMVIDFGGKTRIERVFKTACACP